MDGFGRQPSLCSMCHDAQRIELCELGRWQGEDPLLLARLRPQPSMPTCRDCENEQSKVFWISTGRMYATLEPKQIQFALKVSSKYVEITFGQPLFDR